MARSSRHSDSAEFRPAWSGAALDFVVVVGALVLLAGVVRAAALVLFRA